MVKCKILWFREIHVDYDWDNQVFCDASDWEELSEEDFTLLSRYIAMLKHDPMWIPKLVRQDSRPIITRVKEVRDYLEECKKEDALRKEELEKKRAAREIKKKAKDLEAKKKMLEELKKELGDI